MPRAAPLVLAALAATILLAMLTGSTGGALGRGAFAVAATLFPLAVCAAAARSRAGRVLLAALASWLTLWLVVLAAPPAVTAGALPWSTWWMLAGGGIVPLLVLGLGYAALHGRE